MTEETKTKLRAAGRYDLIAIDEINQLGYAGCNSLGNIVDRRLFPNSIPVQKNTLLGTPEPKRLLVISLLQPWATLLVTKHPMHLWAVKQWETRSWATKHRGFILIHASKKFSVEQQELCSADPFNKYLPESLPLGGIIGSVFIDRIIETELWKDKHDFAREYSDEFRFGNFSDGRYAWKCSEPVAFSKENIISCNGALSVWEYDYKVNGPKKKAA
jgi:hypothetical protein